MEEVMYFILGVLVVLSAGCVFSIFSINKRLGSIEKQLQKMKGDVKELEGDIQTIAMNMHEYLDDLETKIDGKELLKG